MKIWKSQCGKKTKIKCEKCGENVYNYKFYITQTGSYDYTTKQHRDGAWKAKRGRAIYTSNAYVCSDCFVEIMNNLAKSALDHMREMNFKDVKNLAHLEALANIKHERQVFAKIEKEKKAEVLQLKRKERNTGLNVVTTL